MNHVITRKLHKIATLILQYAVSAHDYQLRNRLSDLAIRSHQLRDELKQHNDALTTAHETAKGECEQRIKAAGSKLALALQSAYANHDAELEQAKALLHEALTAATAGHAVITDQVKTEIEQTNAELTSHRNEIVGLLA